MVEADFELTRRPRETGGFTEPAAVSGAVFMLVTRLAVLSTSQEGPARKRVPPGPELRRP